MLGGFIEKTYFCNMNELAINIEYLLLTRNCVIVPGLGSFTTRNFASQWLDEEELFLPPVRHVRFNSDIFFDTDDVFVQSLAQIYNLSSEAASEYCKRMVTEFHKELLSDGSVDFGSIGLFTLLDDAEIVMSPYECGVTSPDYYGLDSLHFPMFDHVVEDLADESTETLTTAPSDEDCIDHKEDKKAEHGKNIILPKPRTYVADSKHIIIRLNRAFVHYTMVAAASVVLFFLLSPVHEGVSADSCQASSNMIFTEKPTKSGIDVKPVVNKEEKLADLVSDTLKAVEKIVADELVTTADSAKISTDNSLTYSKDEKVAENVESTVQANKDKSLVLTELRGAYSIVLASAISQKNAVSFVNHLQEIEVNAIIYDNGKMLRVLIDGFASQADAYNMNNYLHNLDKSLSSSWVMKN